MGQLCDGSYGSWVTKDDPFPSLLRDFWTLRELVPRTTRRRTTILVFWDPSCGSRRVSLFAIAIPEDIEK